MGDDAQGTHNVRSGFREGEENRCIERTLTMWDLSEAKSAANTSPGTILNKLVYRFALFPYRFTPEMKPGGRTQKKKLLTLGG